VSTDFILLPKDDGVERLRSAFSDIWADLLEWADVDTPYLLYSAFADFLLQHRDNQELWERACRFFDVLANKSDSSLHYALTGAFERLRDSDISAAVESRLGAAAKGLFRDCRL
jgi:hypothetical protein